MKRLLFPSISSLLLVLIVLGGWHTMEPNEVILQPESKLWIEGSSTVNQFTCNAKEVAGQARLDQAEVTRQQARAKVQVVVPVRRFDCGKRRMNQDLHEAMQSTEHPFIRYELDEAHLLEQSDNTYRLRANGQLLIAGTERPVSLDVRAERLSGDRYRARGSQKLSMSDFGIDPPTAMLGMIKAHDEIEVHFDLLASAK